MRDALLPVANTPPVPDPSWPVLPATGQPGFADALDGCVAKPAADPVAPTSPATGVLPPSAPPLLPFLEAEMQEAALARNTPALGMSAEAAPDREQEKDAEGLENVKDAAPAAPVPLIPPVLPAPISIAEVPGPPAMAPGGVEADMEAPSTLPSKAKGRPDAQHGGAAAQRPEPALPGQLAQTAPPGTALLPEPPQGHVPHLAEQPPAPLPSTAQAAPARPTAMPLPSPPTTPVQQVMPVIASVAVAPRDGTSHVLIVRLDPAELGRVQVRIEQAAGGPAQVSLVAERPQTLQLLQQDQPQLHRALDLAGILAEGRVIQFQLAPDSPTAWDGAAAFAAGGSAGGLGNPGEGGQPGQQPPNRQGRYSSEPSQLHTLSSPRRRLAGIDITT